MFAAEQCEAAGSDISDAADQLSERLSQLPCHVIYEAMDGDLRDAVTDDRIHGFSYGAEWWFVEAPKIQLRFRSGQRVDGKLTLHERKQVRLGRGLPFEQQPGGRTRHSIKDVLLDAFDGNRS